MYGQQVHLVLITGMLMLAIFCSISYFYLLLYLLCFYIYIVNVLPPLEGALRVFRIANVNKEDVRCRHVQPVRDGTCIFHINIAAVDLPYLPSLYMQQVSGKRLPHACLHKQLQVSSG